MDLGASLASVVGPAHVLVDPSVRASYEVDWTGRWTGSAVAVVRPSSTAEVAGVVSACAAAGVPVVPQGGNTGLVGGAVPYGAVVLSTRRLTSLSPVDGAGTCVAGAGCTLAALSAHAGAAGLEFGVDFASRDSATVGGAVSTNAGGLRVLRRGPMRASVVGVEAVLPSGAVLSRVEGPLKDSTGYDLSGLFCGAEGTLGVLTRVRVRLAAPLPSARTVVLAGLPSVSSAVSLAADVRASLPELSALEILSGEALELVGSPLPGRWPVAVLLETVGSVPDLPLPASADAVVGSDVADRARLWRCREEVASAISAAGVPLKLDVSVPPSALASLWSALPSVVASVAPSARVILFGHLAEANLHVNVLDVGAAADAVSDAVLRLVASAGGSISAEHGVGRAKVAYVPLTRSPAELAAMRSVKAALDPAGVMNPGVLLGPAESDGAATPRVPRIT